MKKEFDKIIESNDCFAKLKNTTVLLTGATGTVGSYILRLLLHYNGKDNAGITLVCPVRSKKRIPDDIAGNCDVMWIEYDFKSEFDYAGDVDYVIHCAGPTRSADMVNSPVDTVNAIAWGTQRLLEFFKEHGRKGFLYVSSVEIYGENFDESKILYEDTMGLVDPLAVRSSYPEAKRLTETLCTAYAHQYNMPVKIARLSQVLGLGNGDNRLIAYLCNCAKTKQPIVLKSDGKATKAYCYIADCASAMIRILVDGECTAYNVANKNMIMSVLDLAKYISAKYLDGNVTVENKDTGLYPKSSFLVMNADKLCALGWQPVFGLDDAFDMLINGGER